MVANLVDFVELEVAVMSKMAVEKDISNVKRWPSLAIQVRVHVFHYIQRMRSSLGVLSSHSRRRRTILWKQVSRSIPKEHGNY